jgi:hypothetical protein
MEREDAFGNPTVGHLMFLIEAYKVPGRLMARLPLRFDFFSIIYFSYFSCPAKPHCIGYLVRDPEYYLYVCVLAA